MSGVRYRRRGARFSRAMRISASYRREHFERVVPIVSSSVSVLKVDFSTVMLKRVNSSCWSSSTVSPQAEMSIVILVGSRRMPSCLTSSVSRSSSSRTRNAPVELICSRSSPASMSVRSSSL